MMMNLNKNIYKVEQSDIRAFNDYAKSVNANIILTLGEPDFNTPDEIKNKVTESLNNNQTKYGPTAGNLSLREKIKEFEKEKNNLEYDVDEIIVTHGSTEALSTALFTILNQDDEVIIPTPAYPMYKQIINFIGAKSIFMDTTHDKFQITKQNLESQISEKTKLIILTSPNNPTGTIYNQESLNAIYDIVKNRNIFVICDDVYNQIIYQNCIPMFAQFSDIKEKIIVCQSYSKSYAMPGWRCGYMLACKDFIYQASKIHQYMIVGLNTFIQDALITALDYNNSEMVQSYQNRRDYIYNRLTKLGLEVEKPLGAFYIFPSIKKFGIKSKEFCERLACEHKVAIIPGSCFNADDYVRFSYCVDFETIEKAMDEFELFIKKIQKL